MRLFIIKKVLVQEKEMSEDRKVSDRIVIIRPIVRGKEIKSKVKNILTIASRFTPSGRAYKKGLCQNAGLNSMSIRVLWQTTVMRQWSISQTPVQICCRLNSSFTD